MKTLDEIRAAIAAEEECRLSFSQIEEITDAIEQFSEYNGYLPTDVWEWYESVQDFVYETRCAMEEMGGDWEG